MSLSCRLKKTCVSCGKCHNICPMDVDPVKNSKSAECIRCGKCVASCPKESLALKFVYGKKDSFINVFRK
nr:4Fe-4S dicluster domain-containing protein [uncultured Dorea sp.]